MKEIAAVIGIWVGFFALCVGFDYKSCKNAWRDSGYECKYDIIGGCLIKNKDGRWIPAKNYRDLM
jgi:hypothetical protein